MDRDDLPLPVTSTDRLLFDIATSLRKMTDPPALPSDGQAWLEEPAATPADDLTCPEPGCGRSAKSPAGLAAHRRSHDA